MRKLSFAFLSALIAIALTATAALADSPHFTRASAAIGSGGSLLCSFKEAGLGTTTTSEVVTCTADASAVYQCFNNGGKHPKAGNKETINTVVSGTDTFPVRNGSASGTITIPAPGPGSFACPAGQTLTFVSVTYSNIALTGSGGETATAPSTLTYTNPNTP